MKRLRDNRVVAAAAVLFEAINRLSPDTPELTLYNTYFGTMPTMLHIRAC